MRRLLCLSIVIVAALSARAETLDLRIEEAQQIIKQRVDNKWNAGIVVGIIDETGTRTAAYGIFKKGSAQKLDAETLFEIGSITKTFTGILLADMAENGEVKLDDPVAKYLPAEVKIPERGGKKITLQHLSQHTSGLPRLPDNMKPANIRDPYADYTVKQLYDYLSGCSLNVDIGTKYDYSNLAVGLLGHALCLKAGCDYEKLVLSRICEPLGMKSTRVDLTPDLKPRLCTGHNEMGAEESNWNLPTLAGAGALKSSVNDMLLYVAANIGLKTVKFAKAIEQSHGNRFQMENGGQIGLGWHVIKSDGDEIITHSGGTGGYRSFAGFIKSKKLGVVILTNSAIEVDDIGVQLLNPKAKLAGKFAKPKTERQELKVDPKIFDSYAGKYEIVPGMIYEISRDGDKLMAQLTGQPKLQVYPESETKFFYKEVDAQIAFVKDEKGNVTQLELFQFGLKSKAWNMKYSRPVEKEFVVDPKTLEQYAGEYVLGPGFVFTISIEDKTKLMAQLTNQPKLQVYAKSENKFDYRIVDAQLTFVKDAAGKVTHLLLNQNGQEMKAARK